MKKRSLAVIACGGVAAALAWFLQPTPAVSQPIAHTSAPQLAPSTLSPIDTSMVAPRQLDIPSLHLTSPIIGVGREPNGEMSTPHSLTDAGWYQFGTAPGNPGKAVIAAHTGYPQQPTKFRAFAQLKEGDTIIITDVAGKKAVFGVVQTATYNPEDAPLNAIFGDSPTARLALITCVGDWDNAHQTYTHRLVVYAVRSE